jgi:hypothetical protein
MYVRGVTVKRVGIGWNENLVAECEVAAAVGGSHYIFKVIPLRASRVRWAGEGRTGVLAC